MLRSYPFRLGLGLLVGIVIAASPLGVNAFGRAWAQEAPATLAVATFDTDRPEPAGATIERRLRISNLSDQPVTVDLSPRGVAIQDNGASLPTAGEDPRWAGRVRIAEPHVTLRPKSSHNVSYTVAIPPDLAPDDYLIAIVVTPQPAGSGSVHLVNAITALVPVTIQGDRIRRLALVDHLLPRVAVGKQLRGQVVVRNIGPTFASAWGEVKIARALPHEQVGDVRLTGRTRVAPGLTRTFTYEEPASLWPGKFTVVAHLFYNRDNATVAELTSQREIWLIHPYTLGGALLVVGVLLVLVNRRRFRRYWSRRWTKTSAQPHPIS